MFFIVDHNIVDIQKCSSCQQALMCTCFTVNNPLNARDFSIFCIDLDMIVMAHIMLNMHLLDGTIQSMSN
jgi:hypothetical protein